MKYFFDTEFIEGTQKRLLKITKPTIDLISIGIFTEDGREYYAISKEFNLKEAWNRWQEKLVDYGEPYQIKPEIVKEYWLRENVLKPIFDELYQIEVTMYGRATSLSIPMAYPQNSKFTYRNLKKLIKKYGKTNAQIAEEIKDFIFKGQGQKIRFDNSIQFYGYYVDYDWVVFCWLFGKMIDLPKGFPMYCIDLKQTLDEKAKLIGISYTIEEGLKSIKMSENYPKQSNEHNALSDAKWNHELYKFLEKL